MTPPTTHDDPAGAFSPVENEAPTRLWRKLRIAPEDGLGSGRRALAAAILTWVPIVAWAVATGRLPAPDGSESILRHFGVHVRCLLAIPLLIAGERMLHRVLGRISGRLLGGGLVPDERRDDFDRVAHSVMRLRDATLPWIVILGLALAIAFAPALDLTDDAIAWAVDANGTLGFGGWWFVHVVRPVYLALALAWLWRLGLVTLWFAKLSKVGITLVPTHPDHVGGMGIIQTVPGAFVPFTLAVTSVIASGWAHRIASHGAHVQDFALVAATFVVVWGVLLLLPLLVLTPMFAKARRQALGDYASLVAKHGDLVRRKWVTGQDVGDPAILSSPELGPVVDTSWLYESVTGMQSVPIGKRTLINVLAPMAVPFLVVVSMEIPLSELLKQVVKALM